MVHQPAKAGAWASKQAAEVRTALNTWHSLAITTDDTQPDI